ncbi:MAG: hypothetical protein F7C81_01765 [Desulfurococcales archaeon]|nr:hypothetical protein [Desulfurococcales archaeon]
MSESNVSRDRKVVLKVEVDYEDYVMLSRIAKSRGYALVTDYLRDLLTNIARGGVEPAGIDERKLAEYISKRIERAVYDIVNPFTGKIDELHRKIAELIERQEERQVVEEVEEAKPLQAFREEAVRPRRTYMSAIERLKQDKVLFSDDLKWLRAPDRFFQKLEREGAVVIESGDEMIAVDRGFWGEFTRRLDEVSVRSLEEVESILQESLGEKASRLFRKLVKMGLAYYDEDLAKWVIPTP